MGIDAVETNTFGANWSNLSDTASTTGSKSFGRARRSPVSAPRRQKEDGRMRWVLGSMGPGTKLPSLGHTSYDYFKQTFALRAEGLIGGERTHFSSKPARTSCRPKPPSTAASRPSRTAASGSPFSSR
ncbi:homocysteine S-methyltransferase family protein [Pseudarthrobacter sp. MM222]|uniref:homocysteine S-methyltransferase family protein n=1 Tax=Pseudarthrobacter sp. MM222 TaxID=3018929 RepID=UPI003FA6F534